MFNPNEFAMSILKSNPKFNSNPMAQQLIKCIQNNDTEAGEALANNILKTYGISKEDGIQQASQGLKQMFNL